MCELIRKMSRGIRFGSSRIHGELLKLGIDISETSVGKYMVEDGSHHRKRGGLSGQSPQDDGVDRFLHRPTIRFQILYVLLVLAHDRRRIVHFNVTAHPTAEWTGQQLREAFPFDQTPGYLLRDRDRIFW
jgi:hypothetical protein